MKKYRSKFYDEWYFEDLRDIWGVPPHIPDEQLGKYLEIKSKNIINEKLKDV